MTGEQLERWRELMSMTQVEAAKALGMSENAYRAMERSGRINKRTELACIALYVGPDKLAQPWCH